MSDKLPPHFLDLVADAALKSFWRRRALQAFLQRCGVKQAFFASWSTEETKRDLLFRLFPLLERTEAGTRAVRKMAAALADQKAFPDLIGWEDSDFKITQAKQAVAALNEYLERAREEAAQLKAQQDARRHSLEIRQENLRRQDNLVTLSERLTSLSGALGSQEAGYDFERWFFDLLDFFEVVCRRPYNVDGRQIDGSATVDGTTYLLELKFTSKPSDGPDVDVFFKKVHDKADNTMGILVSPSGFTKPALKGASIARTPLLLMDHGHLYLMLNGLMSFSELVNRLRRHSSQTSEAYLPASELR